MKIKAKSMNRRCLYCYDLLGGEELDFHSKCSRKIFGTPIPPELPYTQDQMQGLAEQIIQKHTTVTGVQPKLSLEIYTVRDKNQGRLKSRPFFIV
jgi:serine/threonine-protein kinase HipA